MKTLAMPALLLAAVACTPAQVETPDSTIDQAQLERYRRAVPKKQHLSAALPESAAGAGALVGDPAQYPAMAVPHVVGVNTMIGNILDTVEAVVALPPTLYNSETKEFLWGPFDNDDSPLAGDKALVYIKEQTEGEDFQFVFAFARLMGDDVASAVPVIWGGVNPTPDVEDQGNGVLLLDFEASRAFAEANGADTAAEARGRFAAGYARGPNDDGSDSMVTMVVGSFRGFNGEGGSETIDVDHLWGNVEGADGNTIDFMNLAVEGNVLHDSEAAETLDLQLVFWNRGIGRGEALLTGGDAGANIGEGTECWDAAVEQQYYQVTVTDELGAETVLETEGDAATGCPAPFDQSLADLGIPTLADVDGGILEALQNAAENGMGG
ncbi:MAG: hypothetical protein IT383_13535 [Deltaproteobacteria bacterium]|nr:hypothetical protein [Deltaproteobacteria bacterium]